MPFSFCSCRRRPQESDKDVAQIGPKRIRYLGKGRNGAREASRHSQEEEEEEEELSSSVGDRQEALKGFNLLHFRF